MTRSLDAFVERAFEALDEPIPDGFMADVHFTPFETFEDLSPCDDVERAGCVLHDEPTVAWAQVFDAIPHELAHVVHLAALGTSAPLLSEGFAELVGDRVHQVPAPAAASVSELATSSTEDLSYAEAARLVSFIIDRYGISSFKDLFRRSARDGVDPDVWEQALGTSLDDLDREYAAASSSCLVALGACDPKADTVEVPSHLEVNLECSDPASWGFEFFPGARSETGVQLASFVAQPLSIDIETFGVLKIRGDVALAMNPCAPCKHPLVGLRPSLDTPFEAELDVGPGRYEARVAWSGGPPQSQRIDFEFRSLSPSRE